MSDRDIISTAKLITRLKSDDVGEFARQTITHWTRLQDDPMPVYYQGKQGQSNKYDYDDVLAWLAQRSKKSDWTWTATAGETDHAGFEEHRGRLMKYKADQAEMDAAERKGELVEAAAVRDRAFEIARLMRIGFSTISDRVSADFAAETDELKISNRLNSEIQEVLESLIGLEKKFIVDTREELKSADDAEKEAAA